MSTRRTLGVIKLLLNITMADRIVVKKEKEEDTCNVIPSLKNEKEVSFKRFYFPLFLLRLDHLNCVVFTKQKGRFLQLLEFLHDCTLRSQGIAPASNKMKVQVQFVPKTI